MHAPAKPYSPIPPFAHPPTMLDRVETELARRLKARIRKDGPLPFHDFMEAALYDPELGFYSRGPSIGTSDAAFSTSAKFPAFAFALARAIGEAERRAGEPLRVVELGGGTGELASRILGFLDAPREYVVVDASAGLRAEQSRRGVRAVASPREIEPAASFLFGNEVLDALPVHRVVGDGEGGVLEVFVDLNARGHFVERVRPATTPALAARLAAEGVTLARGQAAEVNLGLDAFVANAARVVSRGYAVFIDYGDDAHDLYAPTRLNGTLKAYREQAPSYDAFDRVGEQDLTADVDFTAVATAAAAAGLEDAGSAPQGPWLLSVGIREYGKVAPEPETARDHVEHLTSPTALGSAFRVACFRTPGLPDAPGFVAEE